MYDENKSTFEFETINFNDRLKKARKLAPTHKIPAIAEASFDIVMNSIGFKVVQNTRYNKPIIEKTENHVEEWVGRLYGLRVCIATGD